MLGKATPPPRGEMKLNIEAQRWDHRVARDNARFAKASPAQKRAIIAKDVLVWLAAKKVVATPGVYLQPGATTGGYCRPEEEGEGVELTRVNGGTCQACAIGSVFACAVERTGPMEGFWSQTSWDMLRELNESGFSDAMLRNMETAFEGEAVYSCSAPLDVLKRWSRVYPDANERLAAIMKNIIRNKGEFVPADLPEA